MVKLPTRVEAQFWALCCPVRVAPIHFDNWILAKWLAHWTSLLVVKKCVWDYRSWFRNHTPSHEAILSWLAWTFILLHEHGDMFSCHHTNPYIYIYIYIYIYTNSYRTASIDSYWYGVGMTYILNDICAVNGWRGVALLLQHSSGLEWYHVCHMGSIREIWSRYFEYCRCDAKWGNICSDPLNKVGPKHLWQQA